MSDYYALCAKCRAIYGSMLKREDYRALAGRETISDVVRYLSGTERYRQTFADKNTVVGRSETEHLLRRNYFSLYEKLLLFSGGKQRLFFARLIEKYEIVYLVRAAYAVEGGVRERFAALPDYLRTRARLDFSKICAAQDYTAMTAALAGTRYYGPAAAFLGAQSADVEQFENALYRDYYTRLYTEYSDDLDAKSAAAVRDLLERKADILNTDRAKRAAKYGFFDGDVFLVPIYTKKRRQELSAIMEGKLDPSVTQTDANRQLLHICDRTIASGGQTMAVPYALLIAGEMELKNLTYIIEGIRYGVGSAAIMEKLICQ